MENNKINPFSVLISPRKFIHKGLEKTSRAGPIIAWLLGMTYLFGKAYAFGLGNQYRLSHIILFCLICAIPVGYVFLYVTSFFLYWIGKIFSREASFKEVFAAYLWTRVPEGFILLSWMGLIAIFGDYAFTTKIVITAPVPLFILGLVGVQAVFVIWEAIILFHALGEVQKISAWIAIWIVVFTGIVLFFVDFSVTWLLIQGLDWKPLANIVFS